MAKKIGKFVRIALCVLALGFVAVVAFGWVVFTFFNPHAKARQTSCLSDEKQLGLGLMQYEEDNDGNFPDISAKGNEKATWRSMIYPYTLNKPMYQCPGRDDKLTGPDGFPRSYSANYTGDYSGGELDRGNGAFAGPGSKPVRTKDIIHPESLITLCETSHSNRSDFNIDNLGAFNPGSDALWAGHFGGSNYLFADGHAIYLKPLDTKTFWYRDSSIPLSPGAMTILKNAQDRAGK